MKNKVLKTLVLFLFAIFGGLGSSVLFQTNVFAQSDGQVKLTKLEVNPDSIESGEGFRISGEFAGKFAKEGDTVKIPIQSKNVNLSLQGKIPIYNDKDNRNHIADAIFSENEISIVFCKEVEGLHEISGSFYKDAQATLVDLNSIGTVTIEHKTVTVNIPGPISQSSSSIFYKSGVSFEREPESVTWGFVFNASQTKDSIDFQVTDILNEYMIWDINRNSATESAIFNIESEGNQWYGIEEAKKEG